MLYNVTIIKRKSTAMKSIVTYENRTYIETSNYDNNMNLASKIITFKPSLYNNYKAFSKKVTKNFCPLSK